MTGIAAEQGVEQPTLVCKYESPLPRVVINGVAYYDGDVVPNLESTDSVWHPCHGDWALSINGNIHQVGKSLPFSVKPADDVSVFRLA